ncbi:MAG TPA: hypothetical protein VGG59_14285 [Acidobacteriaceae bacterium]
MRRAAAPASTSRAGSAILAAGLLCGAMDITTAFLTWAPKGVSPCRLLQGIASGLLGPDAFRGGWATVALGLVLHFLIAFTAAAIFYAASRRILALLHHPWLAGIGYALVVYAFMYWVVMPLSRLRRGPVTLPYTVTAIVTHVLCVGLPISLVIQRFSKS